MRESVRRQLEVVASQPREEVKYEYLIDQILPANEIHLVAGPSGSGKTRWLINTLLRWERGEAIFGYRSHPVPWVYIASDRTMDSVTRTFNSMGIDPEHIQIVPAWDKRMSWMEILDAIDKSKAKLAVVESFGSFVDEPGRGPQIKQFLNRTAAGIQRVGITIIGINESPKMKPKDKYELPRMRVSGAAAWGHFSETIFLVEAEDDRHSELGTRKLTICPRNGKEEVFHSMFDGEGRLIFV